MLKMTQQNSKEEKTTQGAWCVSSVVDGQLITRSYFRYTKTEAKEEFKNDLKRTNKKARG
jgi:hypothetical protein